MVLTITTRDDNKKYHPPGHSKYNPKCPYLCCMAVRAGEARLRRRERRR